MSGYTVKFFPEDEVNRIRFPDTPVGKAFRRAYKDHLDDFKRLNTVLKSVSDAKTGVSAFEDYIKQEIIRKLGQECSGNGLWEIRTPKTRRSGVLRTYFCKARNSKRLLVLLDAEFKNDKEANCAKACSRQSEYWTKHDKKN